jgi:hypothetical protein
LLWPHSDVFIEPSPEVTFTHDPLTPKEKNR